MGNEETWFAKPRPQQQNIVYRQCEKPTNPNVGIVHTHTRMEISVRYQRISTQIIIFLKSLL